MYWTPYRPEDLGAVVNWFDKQENFKLPNINKMKALLKSLFFDRNSVQSLKNQKVNKNLLKNYLQDGKISMQEYLYLSR